MMNFKLVFYLIIPMSFIFSYCVHKIKTGKFQLKNEQELVINSNMLGFNLMNVDTLRTPNYFLYSDSFLLEKMHVYQSFITNYTLDTAFFRLSHYRFEDLRNKVAYFYTQFTPEVKLWGKLPIDVPFDSMSSIVNYGTTLIKRQKEEYISNYTSELLLDTIVDNKTY